MNSRVFGSVTLYPQVAAFLAFRNISLWLTLMVTWNCAVDSIPRLQKSGGKILLSSGVMVGVYYPLHTNIKI